MNCGAGAAGAASGLPPAATASPVLPAPAPPAASEQPSAFLGVGITTLAAVVGCALAAGAAIGVAAMRCCRTRQQPAHGHELEEGVGLLRAETAQGSDDILRAHKQATAAAGAT